MADTMQDQTDAGADDSDMTGAGAAGDEASPGYTIEVTVTGDGQISVGVESADEENAEESGGDQAETGDQESAEAKPFKNIKDALTYALQIYKNDGEPPEDDATSESAFQSGYGS